MAVTRMCPNAQHFKEFYGGYHGTCGETGLATALVCATPQTENAQDAIDLMLSMTQEMISLGWADGSGATNMGRLYDEAKRRGFTPDDGSYISYENEVNLDSLCTLLLSTAGLEPIVIEIARAYALPGDESGVHYHFICVVGITPEGYVCNDGDNSAINQHLITYSWAEIEAANPCAVLVIEPKEGAHPVGLPNGWTDDGSALHNPSNKFVVTQGFRDYILNNPWNATDVPIEEVQLVTEVEEFNTAHGKGSRQHFHYSQLSWTEKDGVFKSWLGDEAVFLLAEIVSLQEALSKKTAPSPEPPVKPVLPAEVKTALSAALNAVQPQAALAVELQKALATLA